MKTFQSKNREQGLTFVELLVVMAVLTLLAFMCIPAPIHEKARATRIQCVNNLKQVGIGFRISMPSCGDRWLMRMSTNQGGTIEFTSGTDEFRHFLVMSNELADPKVLFCPTEIHRMRIQANTFNPKPKPGEIPFISNSNLSYFAGIDAAEEYPAGLLSGDRNITNGLPVKNGILDANTNSPAGWTAELHNRVGNILLADGSVQQVSIAGLRDCIENTGFVTNRLQMPIFNP